MHLPVASCASALLLLAPAMFLVAQDKQNTKSVLDGVYTENQAARGGEAYGAHCARCHEGADVDGPALTGTPFIDEWREDSLNTLFTFIRTRMPRDAQGSLSQSMYLDILAHILQNNNYRAGAQELTPDAVKRTQFVGEAGPQPLPNNVLVQVVGCLVPAANNAWVLAKSAAPSRIRETSEPAGEDLKIADAAPLGSQTVRVRNLETVRDFNPETGRGRKTLLQGVLATDASGPRINVVTIKTLASSCTP